MGQEVPMSDTRKCDEQGREPEAGAATTTTDSPTDNHEGAQQSA